MDNWNNSFSLKSSIFSHNKNTNIEISKNNLKLEYPILKYFLYFTWYQKIDINKNDILYIWVNFLQILIKFWILIFSYFLARKFFIFSHKNNFSEQDILIRDILWINSKITSSTFSFSVIIFIIFSVFLFFSVLYFYRENYLKNKKLSETSLDNKVLLFGLGGIFSIIIILFFVFKNWFYFVLSSLFYLIVFVSIASLLTINLKIVKKDLTITSFPVLFWYYFDLKKIFVLNGYISEKIKTKNNTNNEEKILEIEKTENNSDNSVKNIKKSNKNNVSYGWSIAFSVICLIFTLVLYGLPILNEEHVFMYQFVIGFLDWHTPFTFANFIHILIIFYPLIALILSIFAYFFLIFEKSEIIKNIIRYSFILSTIILICFLRDYFSFLKLIAFDPELKHTYSIMMQGIEYWSFTFHKMFNIFLIIAIICNIVATIRSFKLK